MNLVLTHIQRRRDGIFSVITDEADNQVCVGLEHAYDQGDGTYTSKIPPGVYTCQRGMHRLANMVAPFETFEITNVPGHTNILFHKGNYNDDSEGCVLVGTNIKPSAIPSIDQIIVQSAAAFNKLMNLQIGVTAFTLTIKEEK